MCGGVHVFLIYLRYLPIAVASCTMPGAAAVRRLPVLRRGPACDRRTAGCVRCETRESHALWGGVLLARTILCGRRPRAGPLFENFGPYRRAQKGWPAI